MKLNSTERDIWFTSDPHFDHKNVIKYCDRPFSDIDHMNEAIIYNWNKVVKDKDVVFILGDMGLLSTTRIEYFIKRLKGSIRLVRGNHDPRYTKLINGCPSFDAIYDGLAEVRIFDPEIEDNYQRITMCHYPMISWNQSHRGAWQLFGHHHHGNEKGGVIYSKLTPNQLEIGVDGHNFTPISYEKVKELITKQNLK